MELELAAMEGAAKCCDELAAKDAAEHAERGRTGDRVDRIVKTLMEIADKCEASPAPVALAWLVNRQIPVIPIIGAREADQLKSNLGALEVAITSDDIARLDEASPVELGFPFTVFVRDRIKGLVYGGMRDGILRP